MNPVLQEKLSQSQLLIAKSSKAIKQYYRINWSCILPRDAMLAMCAVCVSVCLCPSQVGVLLKRLNAG